MHLSVHPNIANMTTKLHATDFVRQAKFAIFNTCSIYFRLVFSWSNVNMNSKPGFEVRQSVDQLVDLSVK